METQEVLETVRVSDNSVTSCGDGGLEQLGNGAKGSENLGVDLLEDLDSYLEDINDRLMISRMVSDSVIKGMVNAVEQEAAEKIAAIELEVSFSKESLDFFHVGTDKIELSGPLIIPHEPESINYGQYLSFTDACVEHDKLRESLGSLRNAAKEQFKRLKQEIDGIVRCSSIRSIGSGSGSGSELVGLGSILKEKEAESWVGVDRTLGSLEKSVNTIYTRVDDMLQLSKTSLCEWQQEQGFQRELEDMVMQSSIRSLQEEFGQSLNWLEKCNEISSLRKELDAVLKLLPNSETGQLISHGSCGMDHSHRKSLSCSSSLWEGNGKVDESKTGVPENFDAAQFKHMTNKELVNFFNTTITKMKRDHESTVQQMTEEYFSLKGKYLNERGSSLPLRKDKEFDILRKRIPEVILKLDDILVENEKLPTFGNNAESLGILKERLHSLLLENRQLRDLLMDKKNEVKCLSSQVSDDAEKMFQHSLTETNLQKLIANLYSAIEDASIKASLSEEVYKCVLSELSDHIKSDLEESEMESVIMQEIYGIILGVGAYNTETASECEIKESDMESLIMQGMCGIVFREAIKGAEGQLKELYKEYVTEKESRVSLETEVLEKENELDLEVKGKERLKQKVLLLEMSMEENKKLAMEVSASLMNEREQLELASQELNNLRDHGSWQQTLISESSKKLELVNGKLMEALEQIEVGEVEINSLNQKLEQTMVELNEADGQKKMVLALTQEKQNDFLLFEAKEKEHMKQIQVVIVFVSGLLKTLADFESRVTENIKNNNLRLEHSSSQLSSLIKKANVLRSTGLLYKQRLERKCSDLQMAEAEVDLLGDEVDALLSLLEKIYIALDHYSPILQHYPGIIEILKLVRRELSGECTN